jgi:hypothetical protein
VGGGGARLGEAPRGSKRAGGPSRRQRAVVAGSDAGTEEAVGGVRREQGGRKGCLVGRKIGEGEKVANSWGLGY